MKTVTVTVDPEGVMTFDAAGFKWKGCEETIKKLMEAVGVKDRKVVKVKPEFYTAQQAQGMEVGTK